MEKSLRRSNGCRGAPIADAAHACGSRCHPPVNGWIPYCFRKADWSWRHDLRWLQVPPSSCEPEDHSLGQPVAESFRASSLDKLPQLFNVIRGDMSLIGPRPRAPAEFNDYFAQAPECLFAKPGLTSILQGYNPPLSDLQTEIALDFPLCAQLVDRVRPRAPEQGHCCGS